MIAKRKTEEDIDNPKDVVESFYYHISIKAIFDKKMKNWESDIKNSN